MHGKITIIVLVFLALLAMKRDFPKGLCVALAMFAVVTNRLSLAGGAFELTFQRVLLLVVVGFWAHWAMQNRPLPKIPFFGLIMAWWVLNIFSLAFSMDFKLSLKWFMSFSTEVVLFYVIVSTALTDAENIQRAFRALCFAAGAIALLGVVEHFKDDNIAMRLLGADEGPPGEGTGILVTFQHRILLGYSMAMGWPLLLALAHSMQGRPKTIAMGFVTMCAISSSYFSDSRGPWFGVALGGGAMYVLAGKKVRRSLQVLGVLAAIVIVVRPGIRATLVDLVTSTFDKDSLRGASYEYRKELWPVGAKLANSSVVRALVGHGGMTTEIMDLAHMFKSGGNTGLIGYSSWDNNYASDLVEFGYIGLGIEFFLNGAILWTLWRSARRCAPEYQDMAAAIFASAVIYVYALTNVYMFSPQLKCMFLTLVAIGSRLPSRAAATEVEETAPEPVPEGTQPATANPA